MACNPVKPATCVNWAIGSAANTAVPAAWDAICKSFADGAATLFHAFAGVFASNPDLDIARSGIASPYGISLVLGSVIAALLIFGQVIRTVWTRDGTGMAQALTGTVRAVLAWLVTASVATAALAAADSAARYVVDASFGSQQGFADKLTSVVNWSGITTIQPLQAITGASLILVLAVIGIVLVIILWFEMLLRNAALAVVIAVSPIAAAGQAGGEATRAWWTRTVSAAVQLIILKVVIALVFAVGFGMAGTSSGIAALLSGLLVLLLGVFAWPVVARFFTFASVQAASAGLAGVLGFAAGMTAGRGGGHVTAGVDPGQFSRASEARVMGAADGHPGDGASGAGGGGGALLGTLGFALRKAHQGGTLLAGRFEQTAGHAGMSGAYPYSTIASGQRIAPRRAGSSDGQPPPGPGGGEGHGDDSPGSGSAAGTPRMRLSWPDHGRASDDERGEPDD